MKSVLSVFYREYLLLTRGSRYPMTTERKVINDFIQQLNPGDVFYDIGAFYGEYSFQASMHGASEIVAFEPHPAIASEFRSRLDEYRNSWLYAGNVDTIDLHQVALSDSNGAVSLTDEFENRVCPGILSGNESGRTTVNVEATRGDEIIAQNQLPLPDILKIDVEGAEMRVLKGLEQTLSDGHCRRIYLEVHPPGSGVTDLGTFGDDSKSLFELLDRYGFEPSEEFVRLKDRLNVRLDRI